MYNIIMMYMGGETMHIAICDDEEFFRKSLIEQLNKYSIEKGLDFLYYEYKIVWSTLFGK